MEKCIFTIGYTRFTNEDECNEMFGYLKESKISRVRFNLKAFTIEDTEWVKMVFRCMAIFTAETQYQFKVYLDIPFPRTKLRLYSMTGASRKVQRGKRINASINREDDTPNYYFYGTEVFECPLELDKELYYNDGLGILKLISSNRELEELIFEVCEDFEFHSSKAFSNLFYDRQLENWQTESLRALELVYPVEGYFLSFVESISDIEAFGSAIGMTNASLIAKIETETGVDTILNILDCCDGVVIARGDLFINCDLNCILEVQKEIAEAAKLKNKSVFVATGILDSLIDFPFPKRSDITDFAGIMSLNPDFVVFQSFFTSDRRIEILRRYLMKIRQLQHLS